MHKLKAILFDVDGTLAETERYGHRVATNLGFKACGLDWQWSEELYGELLKKSLRLILAVKLFAIPTGKVKVDLSGNMQDRTSTS